MKQVNATAIVSSNSDKAGAGRIDAAVQQTDGQVYPVQFEPISTPGWFSPPEPGDAVEVVMPEGEDLVEFAHDVRYRGQVFDEGHPPPADFKQPGPNVTRRGYFTKGGHRLIFEDFKGSEEVTIKEGKSGNSISLTGLGQIRIENKLAGSSIVLEPTGAITITPGSPMKIDGDDVQLTSSPADDFLVKGTAYNSNLATYLAACSTLADDNVTQFAALEAASTGPLAPLAAAFGLIKTAWTTYKAAVTAFDGAAASWLSAKAKTG